MDEELAKQQEIERAKHQEMVDELVERLETSGRYDSIETKIWFHRPEKEKPDRDGEADVLAYHVGSDTYHFYEVKNNSTKNNFKKSRRQYKRFCRAFPERRMKGIYVSPQRVCRLRHT